MLLTVNANSEFTWATADTVLVYKLFVLHSSWILGLYERNIVLTYILRASSLSCQDKIIVFRILRFCGVEESIWSGITNPFSDFPKETHPEMSNSQLIKKHFAHKQTLNNTFASAVQLMHEFVCRTKPFPKSNSVTQQACLILISFRSAQQV